MTIFKTYLKVLNKNKWIILLYTVILLIFGIFNFQTNDNTFNFNETKPDVSIVNLDKDNKVTQNLIQFLEKKTNIISLSDDPQKIDDAIFYRKINYAIEIPNNYGKDFLNHQDPLIKIQSSGDYNSSFAEMLLNRYLKIANYYNQFTNNEEELLEEINQTLNQDIEVNMTSKINIDDLSQIAFYYNFSNYSILAGCIYVICLLLTIFKSEKIQKRTIISNTKEKQVNRTLFWANSLFAFSLSGLYILFSIILIGKSMLTFHGLLFIINFLIFTICAMSIAFALGNLIKNKDIINSIINVIALGSSFLCGAFVPIEFLPDSVLKIAHILPSYYFINNNEVIKTLEEINIQTLFPFIENLMILGIFILFFTIATNYFSKKNRY